MYLHKKKPKRIIKDDAVYFITTKTKNNFSSFKSEILCELFLKQLHFCKQIKHFKLYAFVIMYDHVHLLLEPSNEFNISKIMKSLKENSSRDFNKMMLVRETPPFRQPTITVDAVNSVGATSTSRLRCNIDNYISRYKNHVSLRFIPKFAWQKSYYDHIIRNQREFDIRFNYIGKNPHKHHEKYGNPINWKYVYPNLNGNNFDGLVDEYVI